MKAKIWIRIAFGLGASCLAIRALGDDAAAAPNQPPAVLTSHQFVTDAATGGMKEICLSEAVLAGTTNTDITRFAKHMVKDHVAVNKRLEKLAGEKGLSFPPTNTFLADDPNWSHPLLSNAADLKGAELLTVPPLPNLSDYQALKQLRSLTGDQLDRTYLSDMASDHLRAVNAFEAASQSLSDPELKRFAASTLPTLRRHAKMARELNDKYYAPAGTSAGNPPPSTASSASVR